MDEKKIRNGLKMLKSNGAFAAMNQDAIDMIEGALTPEPRFYKNQPVKVKSDMGFWAERFFVRYLDDGLFEVKAGPDVNSQDRKRVV